MISNSLEFLSTAKSLLSRFCPRWSDKTCDDYDDDDDDDADDDEEEANDHDEDFDANMMSHLRL